MKIKKVTQYIADDGSVWASKQLCLNQDKLLAAVNRIMKRWPKNPDDDADNCNFGNGKGFIQLTPEFVKEVQSKLCDLGAKLFSSAKPYFEGVKAGNTHPSYVARLLSDSGGYHPLSNAWNRLMCVDNRSREWGQQYYAINPERGDQVCVAKLK